MSFSSITTNLGKSINTLNVKLFNIFYGKNKLSPSDKKSATPKQKLDDIGVNGVLDIITSLDLCAIISYALGQSVGALNTKNNFDPTNKPIDKQKLPFWEIQKLAFDIQYQIDSYYAQYASGLDKNSLSFLIQDITTQLLILQDKLKKNNSNAYNRLALITMFIPDVTSYLTDNSNLTSTSDVTVQKVVRQIDNVRNACIKIQSFSLENLGLTLLASLDPNLQSQIKKLETIIEPSKLIPTLKSILQSTIAIEKFCSMLVSIIRVLQFIIKIATDLIRIFTILVYFFLGLPIPNMFTTGGITTGFAAAHSKLSRFIENTLNELKVINDLLASISVLVTTITVELDNIILKLNAILLNLESCNNAPTSLTDDLKTSVVNLQNLSTQLKKFNSNYQDKIKNLDYKIGDYTISIVKEQVSDKSIHLSRRYGIAIDGTGKLAVESTPTFASDDNIIVEEVKMLLSSKGLINPTMSSLSIDQLSVLQIALSYLEDDEINQNFDFLTNDSLDDPNNENENTGLGLNAFVNKLSGGKKLRKRMRTEMSKVNQKLKQDLGTSGNISTSIVHGVNKI
ncbi:MAG: hypothetical protein WCO84_05940 [bacterium]